MANSLGAIGFHVIVALAALSLCFQSSEGIPSGCLRQSDLQRFENVFQSAFSRGDLAAKHWSAEGLRLLGKDVPDGKKVCSFAQENVDSSKLESIFHASSISKILGNCKLSNPGIEERLRQTFENGENSNAESLFYATLSQLNMGAKIDEKSIFGLLENEIEKAESAESASLLWLAASALPGNHNLKPFTEAVEDILQQADEMDTVIQFSGGLSVTSSFVRGSFGLAAKSGSLPTGINERNIVLFAEYFVQNKFVANPSGAYAVLSALNLLAKNEFLRPLVLTVPDQSPISEKNPYFKVQGSDLMGNQVGDLNVNLISASLEDESNHVTNLKMNSAGNSVYQVNFWNTKPGSGIYTASVSAESKADESVLIPVKDAKFLIKVVVKVTVDSSEFQIIDKDQSLVAKTVHLEYPKTSQEKLEVDHHQKIVMKFTLKDITTNAPITAHQTFVRMTHSDSKKEIFFVAESNNDKEYKFDLDIGTSGESSFGSLSGKYDMSLIIGDAIIENPFLWNFGSLHLKFAKEHVPKKPKEFFKPRPEIHHLFREPEPRPPAIVTSVFSVLVLSPILILLASWLVLGANLRGLFHTGLNGILFAIGLAAILSLLFLYWLRLNMFDTLKYLGLIGVVTAFFGQRMLRQIATSKKA